MNGAGSGTVARSSIGDTVITASAPGIPADEGEEGKGGEFKKAVPTALKRRLPGQGRPGAINKPMVLAILTSW
jgi:hypothetical protein